MGGMWKAINNFMNLKRFYVGFINQDQKIKLSCVCIASLIKNPQVLLLNSLAQGVIWSLPLQGWTRLSTFPSFCVVAFKIYPLFLKKMHITFCTRIWRGVYESWVEISLLLRHNNTSKAVHQNFGSSAEYSTEFQYESFGGCRLVAAAGFPLPAYSFFLPLVSLCASPSLYHPHDI